jgi:hypothetical protein
MPCRAEGAALFTTHERQAVNRQTHAADTVILAGSGRSGTTWLGSILNSYEKSEYFYEITNYSDLDFGDPRLLMIKYPLTHGWAGRPDWVAKGERRVAALRAKWGPDKTAAQRTLRVHADHPFHKQRPDVALHKIVTLYGFVLRRAELVARYGGRLKVVHLVRNPYAQIASELRIDARDPDRSKAHFRQRVEQIRADSSLTAYHPLACNALDRGWVFQMALVWRVSNELLLEDTLLDKRLVVYERLCAEPMKVVADLFDYLGWKLSPQTERYVRDTSEISPSEAESGLFSVRKNAEESLTRWRAELDEAAYSEASEAVGDSKLMDLWSPAQLRRHA